MQNTRVLNILRASVKLLSGGMATAVIGFAFSSFSTLKFGPSTFGNFVLFQSFIILFSTIFSLQTWQPFLRELAHKDRESSSQATKVLFSQYFFSELIVGILGFVVGVTLIDVFYKFFGADTKFISLPGLVSIIVLQVSTMIGWLRFSEKYWVINFYYILQSSILLVISMFSYYFTGGIDFLIDNFFWAYIVSFLFLLINTLAMIKVDYLSFGVLLRVVRKCIPFYAVSSSDSLARDLLGFIINFHLSSNAVAFYKILTQFGALINKLAIPIYQASFVELNALFFESKHLELKNIVSRISLLILFLSSSVGLMLVCSYDFWVSSLFSVEYLDNKIAFSLYIFVQIIVCSFVLVHPLFVCLQRDILLAAITMFSNLVLLAFVNVLSPSFGLYGVIVSLLVQTLIVLVFKAILIAGALNENIKN